MSSSTLPLTIWFRAIPGWILGQMALALFTPSFWTCLTAAVEVSAPFSKVSCFLLAIRRWFKWWQLRPLKSSTTWTTFSKVKCRCQATVRCQQKCLKCVGNVKRMSLIWESFSLWVHGRKEERDGAEVNTEPWVSYTASTRANHCE